MEGVPTRFNDDIPLSRVFLPQASDAGHVADVAICSGSWKQAEASPEKFSSFIRSEVEAGWLVEAMAVGKCNIVYSDGRKAHCGFSSLRASQLQHP